MNEKLARKDCPFRSYPTATCKGESCSWYMREYEKCVIVHIGENINNTYTPYTINLEEKEDVDDGR